MNPIFETIRKRILKGLPAISFFFFLYSIIVGLFGTRYAVVVSIFTSFFQSQRLKDHTIFFYIRLLFNSFLLCFLAYVSSFSLTFCILLNFTGRRGCGPSCWCSSTAPSLIRRAIFPTP